MDLGLISKRASGHRFIFSGGNSEISSEVIRHYKNCINKLGGTFLDCSTEQFISSCTHVLCFSLISSVKIMGGLASGKWLVDKRYIDDSVANNMFLPEDDYEVDYYNNVAKHCRLLNGKLYLHFCFYLETKVNYKCYKRVFVAGGAMVLTKEEAIEQKYKIDYAFCDQTTYFSVQEILANRPNVPILNLDYIRYTIFLKHDPRDFKKFLVDKNQNVGTIRAASELGKINEKRLYEFFKKESIYSKLQSTPRILRRTTARRNLNVQGTILPYFMRTNVPNYQIAARNKYAKKPKAELNESTDDIEIIGEFISGTKNVTQNYLVKPYSNILPSSELSLLSSQISSSVKDIIPICVVKNKSNHIENGHTIIDSNSVKNFKNKIPHEFENREVLSIGDTVNSDSKSCSKNEFLDLSKKEILVSFENDNRIEETNLKKVNKVDMLEVLPNEVPTIQVVRQDSLLKSVQTDMLPENLENTIVNAPTLPSKTKVLTSDQNLNEIQISDKYIPMCNESDNSDTIAQKVKKDTKSAKNEIFLLNKASLLKAGKFTIKLDFKILMTTLRKFLSKLNTSHYFLLNNIITTPKIIPNVIEKENVSKASCPIVVKAVELKPEDTILHNTIFEFNSLKICSEKVGRHVLKVAKVMEKVYDEEDALIAMCYLQWLQCQIQKDYYPNSKVIGDLIRLYIMKIPFGRVRKRALNIFGELLSLHPPHTASLRNYYINIFSDASPNESHQGSNKVWEFISSVIEKALTKPSSDEDCDSSNELCHTFLSFIVHILELDLIYYNDRPVSIKTLICYHIFWPTKIDNPSVVNNAVKNLLQFWMLSIHSEEIVRSLLTRLLCIMLEMLWKWSELSNPLLIAEWPLDRKWMSVSNEILVKFRGLDDVSPLLQLLKYVEMPWQRLLLSSLIYRVIQPSFHKASLTNIKDALKKYVYECKVEQNFHKKSTSCSPHHTVTEVLVTMFVSYVDSSGHKFCRHDICQQFNKSLKKEHLDCDSQENEKSTLKTPNTNSLKRKHSDSEDSHDSQSTSSKIQQIVSENISMDSNGISKEMVIKMLDVFHRLPYYLKSFEGYRLKCSHINEARLIENLHYS